MGYIKSEREERRRGENQSVRGANSSESEKERFWCVKEGRERRIRVVLLAKGKRCARRVGISIWSANSR